MPDWFMMKTMSNTAIIILAAGASKRLGRPKQLLGFRGRSLLEHIVFEAQTAALSPLIVITGSGAEALKFFQNQANVETLFNEAWETGMASGIVKGISALKHTTADSVILSVCDQPFVSATVFLQLIQARENSSKAIIACSYAGTVGTPVLFDRIYFERLQQLTGDEGAKTLVKKHQEDLHTIVFEEGKIDIDTQQDYENLLSGLKNN